MRKRIRRLLTAFEFDHVAFVDHPTGVARGRSIQLSKRGEGKVSRYVYNKLSASERDKLSDYLVRQVWHRIGYTPPSTSARTTAAAGGREVNVDLAAAMREFRKADSRQVGTLLPRYEFFKQHAACRSSGQSIFHKVMEPPGHPMGVGDAGGAPASGENPGHFTDPGEITPRDPATDATQPAGAENRQGIPVGDPRGALAEYYSAFASLKPAVLASR